MAYAEASVPAGAKFLVPGELQVDSPHMAAGDIQLTEQTNALMARHLPARHGWWWGGPDDAPYISLSTANTWTELYTNVGSNSALLRLPWYVSQNIHRVRLDVVVATPWPTPLIIRGQLRQFYDAYSGSNSTESLALSQYPSVRVQSSRWTNRAPAYGIRMFKRVPLVFTNFSNALPSNRRVAIQINAKYAAANLVSTVSNTYQIYLHSIRAVNEITPPGEV